VKRLSWIVTLPITAVAVVFAVANRQSVTLELWPFGISITLPLFLLVLASLLIGFLLGALVLWLSSGRARARTRAAASKSSDLERELAQLRRKLAEAPPGEAPPGEPLSGETSLPVSAQRR